MLYLTAHAPLAVWPRLTFGVKELSLVLKPRRTMAENTVSAAYVKSLVALAVSRGADRAALLERAGINPVEIADPDKRMKFERFKMLMAASKALTNDPALALRFGGQLPFAGMSIVGLICQAAETMGAAFTEMNRYARLVIEVDGHETGDRFQIVKRENGVWLEDRRRHPNDFPELTESTWTRFIVVSAQVFPRTAFAKAAYVPHAAPSYRAQYEALWQVPVHFDSGRNALLIEESWLALKINQSNRYAFGIFSERAEAMLKTLLESKTVRGRVESTLIPILHTGQVGMADVARKIGLSRATLYRQLREEDVGYDAVLDELRHRMALHYLDGRKVSASQTAYLVGFANPAAFSRAFKRWTGKSPKEYSARN
jgi:AraC-like DNA-binding protein